MASLGRLTAGIAHEIMNPLNFVNNFAEISVELLGELNDITAMARPVLSQDDQAELDDLLEKLSQNLSWINEHGNRADSIVKNMLLHTRGDTAERRDVDINALLEESLKLAYHGARAKDKSFNVELERSFDANAGAIRAAPQEIGRVFLNIISNGFYAVDHQGRSASRAGFKPLLKVTTRDLGQAVEVQVRDNGTGISKENLDRIFDPFFSTKPTGEGTGLGLSLSHDIVVSQHGGSIEVSSAKGEFAEFTITLPRQSLPGVTKTSGID
jgi:signal transduction histidine kinase